MGKEKKRDGGGGGAIFFCSTSVDVQMYYDKYNPNFTGHVSEKLNPRLYLQGFPRMSIYTPKCTATLSLRKDSGVTVHYSISKAKKCYLLDQSFNLGYAPIRSFKQCKNSVQLLS